MPFKKNAPDGLASTRQTQGRSGLGAPGPQPAGPPVSLVYAGRITALRAALAARGADAAVITSAPNVRYFSGFTGSNGALLVSAGQVTLFTDPRYTLQAGRETAAKVVIAKGPLESAIAAQLASFHKVAFENTRISFRSMAALQKARIDWCALDDTCEVLRMVKSDAEQEAIRASVLLNSAALDEALTHFRAGMTETDLAAEIEYRMRRRGAEKPAFETIVAFGERSALPHAHPGPASISGRGLLLIDMGAFLGGYASDMTRMAHLGKAPTATRQLYDAVSEAQLAALDRVKAGVTAASVDAAARKVLTARGYGKAFVHSTGHGLGLEIHEMPRIGKQDKTRLEAGMVITIEPGAYLEGFGGVRIEDTVLVTASGCEILTPTAKKLLVL